MGAQKVQCEVCGSRVVIGLTITTSEGFRICSKCIKFLDFQDDRAIHVRDAATRPGPSK